MLDYYRVKQLPEIGTRLEKVKHLVTLPVSQAEVEDKLKVTFYPEVENGLGPTTVTAFSLRENVSVIAECFEYLPRTTSLSYSGPAAEEGQAALWLFHNLSVHFSDGIWSSEVAPVLFFDVIEVQADGSKVLIARFRSEAEARFWDAVFRERSPTKSFQLEEFGMRDQV